MRLVLTRAAEDATRTRQKLEAAGHSVILSPVTDIVAIESRWPAGAADALLATSAHALVAATPGLSPEVRRVMPLYLVGSRTVETARRHGFLGEATTAKNAATLALAVGKLAARPKRIVYLAGRDRKPDIETALGTLGLNLAVVEVYEARAQDALNDEALKALRRDMVDGVLHFSRRSAALLIAAASGSHVDIRRPAHFCLSEDVAAPLRDAGCTEIYTAEAPNEAQLLALVDEVELWLSKI